jgi:HlyD family secretion protein
MGRKFILPIVAVIGLLFALFMVFYGARKPLVPPIEFPPPKPPYKHSVSGAGLVEAASEDVAIGTPFNELVTHVYVKSGDELQEGTPLFALDTRDLVARLEEAKRKKEVAITNYEDQQTQLNLYENLKDKRAVSENEFNQRFYAAELALRQIKEAEASIEVIETNIERSIVRAPFTGKALRVNVRPGEAAEKNPFDTIPLILFGQIDPLHIRVEVDEDDAWRIEKGAPAMAFVRGNSSIKVPLEFLYIEPFVLPKRTLTGDNRERVDTRVLQIVYQFHRNDLPIYPGQIMDVYIKGLASDEKF